MKVKYILFESNYQVIEH